MVGGMLVSPQFAQFGNEAQQGLGLLFLKYGRDNESESDKLGVEYSTKIGYDAQEMAGFFETLNRLSQESGAGEIPSFLSTHPHPTDRFAKVKRMASESQTKNAGKTYKIEREAYLKMVDGLVYGEDPRQGFVDDHVFYHPELKFQFPFPDGWKLHNSPTQVQVVPENGKALLVFTLSSKPDLDAAVQELVDRFKLTVKETSKTKVNGFPALSLLAEQVSTNQSITLLSYLIQKEDNIYMFLGLSNTGDFSSYKSTLSRPMTSFKRLTDPKRLNVKPQRIRVRNAPRNMTLSQAFNYFKVPEEQHAELAIVNGLELNQEIKKGVSLKILGS